MDWTRRRTLHAVAAATTAALAGCDSTQRASEEAPRRASLASPSEYETVRARSTEDAPLFRSVDETTADRPVRTQMEFVTSTDELADLAFASGDPASELRAFADETDYESQSLLLYTAGVRACFDLELTGVRRERDDAELALCQSLRPADADCELESWHNVGFGVRFDAAGDDISGFGVSSSRCRSGRPEPLSPAGGDGA